MLLCGVSVLLAPFVYLLCTWGLPPLFIWRLYYILGCLSKRKKNGKGQKQGGGEGEGERVIGCTL